MATITFSRSFSFQGEPLWAGVLSEPGVNAFVISDVTHSLTFTGDFTYPDGVPAGTVQSIIYRDSNGVVYTFAGIGREVAAFAQAALSTGLTADLYAQMLDGNDTLRGSAGDDSLLGFAGNDLLDGRAGADVMAGSTGNDTYVVDNLGDVVDERVDEGIDQVNVAVTIAGGTYTLGDNVESARLINEVAFNLTGNGLANTLVGNAAANRLDGGLGANSLQGGAGNDAYVVDDAGDMIFDSAGTDSVEASISYTLSAHVENLVLTGSVMITGTGNAGANILDGTRNSAANVLAGLAGNDTYNVGAGDSVVEAFDGGIDRVRATVDYQLEANIENLTLIGTANLEGKGNDLGNVLTGNSGNNKLDGVGGVDTLIGGLGDDQYVVDLTAGNQLEDSIVELAGAGNDTLTLASVFVNTTVTTLVLADTLENIDARDTGVLSLNLTGNASNNIVQGNNGNNILNGLAGADTLIGHGGNDTYELDVSGDQVVEQVGEGTDTVNVAVATAGGTYALSDNVENARLTNSVAFTLVGNALDNTLVGNGAANRLDGGLGADDMQGGAGNDTYVVDNLGDQVTDSAGVDTVQAAISYTLASSLENLVLLGATATGGTGNALANTLDGTRNTAANRLIGLGGNDTYIVDANDIVVEAAAGGTDTVRSAFNHSLADNVENLALIGTASVDATGNAQANTIIGNAGNNALNGADGVDTLQGGAGNDDYLVELGQDNLIVDRIIEAADAGIDFVVLRAGNSALVTATTIFLGANLEALDASAAAGVRLDLSGNAADNQLFGNDTDNLVDGGAGADLMLGGAGHDTYVVDNLNDDVLELVDEGDDQVNVAISVAGGLFALGDNIERGQLINTVAFDLAGNDLANQLLGNAAANRIDGGLGADDMQGGAGNDTYGVDDAGDQITDTAGTDTVESSISYILGATLENLALTGSDAVSGTGNEAANLLDGSLNSAGNLLTGRGGNDTYVVGDGDTVSEAAGGGIDTVRSDLSFTLGDNLENLTLTGAAPISGTGNAQANVITGNSADNELDGRDGLDTLQGGAGDDTYWLDLSQSNTVIDQVVENAHQGNDLLLLRGGNPALASAVSLTLQAHVEHIDAAGAGAVKLSITGNATANFIGGNDADNLLNGAGGADTLVGRAGNDTYVVDNEGDEVAEQAGEGIDSVSVNIAAAGGLYLLGNNIENSRLINTVAFDLTGNAANNNLIGNAADNRIDGGAGADLLQGLAGNDTYVVDNAGDRIIDTAGVDTVESSISYTLGAGVEQLVLTGSGLLNGTGNAQANVIIGNSGANLLDGLGGVDTLRGGAGDDIYVVALNASNGLEDLVVENAGEGSDTLRLSGGNVTAAQATLTLGANLENLDASLVGAVLLALTGNAAANRLTGNDASNLIDAGAGDDRLFGGLGNDSLIGGTGSDQMSGGEGDDTYSVDSVGDTVIEVASQGIDLVSVAIGTTSGTYTLAANVENATLSNTVSFNLIGNTQDNILVGNAAANVLNGAVGADVMDGGAGNDTYHVDDVGDVIIDSVGIDTVVSRIDFSLDGSSLDNLLLTGTADLFGEGNELANRIIGNSGNNVIDGLGGVDRLEGGAGDDQYFIDLTASNGLQDTVIELPGQGRDSVMVFGGSAGLATATLTLGANVEELDASLTEDGVNLDLLGNALDNVLTGNSAQNTFTGGLGSDVFVFAALTQLGNSAATRDSISDFESGVDEIDLTGIADFALVAAADGLNGTANQVWLDQGVLHGTLDGTTQAFEIVLTGVNTLAQSDFTALV